MLKHFSKAIKILMILTHEHWFRYYKHKSVGFSASRIF